MKERYRVCILAQVPVWTLPGLGHLIHPHSYATWLESLIPEFSKHEDLEIHWITMCKETNQNLVHKCYGQTFHILSRGSKAVQMATGYIGESLRIRKIIKKIQPDLVHAWGSEDVYGIAGALCGISNRIFTLQGCLTEYLRHVGGGFLFRLQAMYEIPTVWRYRLATAESPGAKRILESLNSSIDVSLVEYGINPCFFSANWNPGARPEVLFIGNICHRKGIKDLIAAAANPELSHIIFRIVGSGDLKNELQAKSTQNVEWLGSCDREEVICHLESAWALVIPTYSDTGPTVLKEARVIGLPVVATSAAGASCYIQNGKNGFVVDAGDKFALIIAIQELCHSREHAITAGSHRWDEHRKLLHPSVTTEKFSTMYRLLVDQH